MNGNRSESRSGFGGTERNHAANDRVEIGGGRPSLEPAILAINAVEKMVPLFNRLVKLSYLTDAEHAEFIQLYKLLAARLDAVRVTRPRTSRLRIVDRQREQRIEDRRIEERRIEN